jgi:LysM repeat protein
LEQIHTVLCSKSARLVLTLADCCNFNNNRNDVFWRFEDEADIASINQSKNLNYLFKESRGQVLACSSKKGTVSYYSNNLGGYFTLSFFETIRTESATDVSLTWETVLQTTKQLTNQVAKGYKVTQIPAYNITMDKRNLFNQEISNEALTEKRISIKIKNGNTLFGISEKYKVTVESLMKWNNISSSRIYAGQTIFIYLSN